MASDGSSGISYRSEEDCPLSIIQAVLRAGTDNDSNERYQEMEKYEVTDLF